MILSLNDEEKSKEEIDEGLSFSNLSNSKANFFFLVYIIFIVKSSNQSNQSIHLYVSHSLT